VTDPHDIDAVADETLIGRLMRTLAEPAVRDLAWTIGSPTLTDPVNGPFSGRAVDDGFCAAELAHAEPWLTDLDNDPAPLHTFLEQHHSHRLGHYFENLIAFWLQHADATDLHTRLQVREGGQALGEFDFVFRHPRWGNWLHWEAAVKFYLQATADARWDAFVGPNPTDRLSDKLHKLFDRQLHLADTAAGRAALGVSSAAPTARAFVKGYLFFPAGASPMQIPGLSRHCIQGWWVRHGETPVPAHDPRSRWKVLPRLAWLAPARAAADDMNTVFDTAHMTLVVARHFARSKTPLLLAEMESGANGNWREISRGFVVSPQWPAT
jgi:hypothetical protein